MSSPELSSDWGTKTKMQCNSRRPPKYYCHGGHLKCQREGGGGGGYCENSRTSVQRCLLRYQNMLRRCGDYVQNGTTVMPAYSDTAYSDTPLIVTL